MMLHLLRGRTEIRAAFIVCGALTLLAPSVVATGLQETAPATGATVPQRIVAAGPAVLMIADAIYAFPGAGERLVAVGAINQGRGNFLAAIDPAYGTKTILDRQVNAEAVLAARPDLVVLKSFLRDGLGGALERAGASVLYLDLETPEQYRRDLAALGAALGEPARADELWAYYDDVLTRVSQRIERSAGASRPRTLFLSIVLAQGGVSLQVPPDSWIQTELVRRAGGEPVWTGAASGGWTPVSVEQVLAWQPEVTVVVSYRTEMDEVLALMADDPRYAPIYRAEADGGAPTLAPVPVDFYSWDQPDVRWGLGLLWMAKTLHPDRFADIDLRDEVYRFYGEFYGMDRATTDAVIFSRLTGALD